MMTSLCLKITVFSKEHKRLNKIVYELRGLNARQIMMEFPNKGWKECIINRLLHKLRNDDTVDNDLKQHLK